ncbi:MAG: hypothetical protein ACJ8DN_15700, partial [Microvirga sp.]
SRTRSIRARRTSCAACCIRSDGRFREFQASPSDDALHHDDAARRTLVMTKGSVIMKTTA